MEPTIPESKRFSLGFNNKIVIRLYETRLCRSDAKCLPACRLAG